MELRKALDELVSDALKEVTPEEVLSEDTLRKLLLDTLKKQSAFKYSFDLDGDFEVVYSATRGKIKLRFDILKTVKRAVLIAGGAGGVYISSANKEGRERLSKVLAKIACELYPEAYYCDFLWVPAS